MHEPPFRLIKDFKKAYKADCGEDIDDATAIEYALIVLDAVDCALSILAEPHT